MDYFFSFVLFSKTEKKKEGNNLWGRIIKIFISTQPYRMCTHRVTKLGMVLSICTTTSALVYICCRLVVWKLFSCSPNTSHVVSRAGKPIVSVVYCLSKQWLSCETINALHLSGTILTYKFYNDSFLRVESCCGYFHGTVLYSELAVLGPV